MPETVQLYCAGNAGTVFHNKLQGIIEERINFRKSPTLVEKRQVNSCVRLSLRLHVNFTPERIQNENRFCLELDNDAL